MPGARAGRRRRLLRTAAALATLALAVPTAQAGSAAQAGSTAQAGSAAQAGSTARAGGTARVATPIRSTSSIPLATPVHDVDPLANPLLGLRKDRLKKSVVPGRVDDREDVTVALGADGTPATVTDLQRLVITGAGGYVIRERGPARAAVGLGASVPPVLELGTVVWQGFSPGRRALAARLTLDAGLEAGRLPMRVVIAFRDRTGRPRPLDAGGRAPADGTATVTLVNQTASARTVTVGRAAVSPLAAALDTLYDAGRHPRAGVPPVAGAGLPRRIPGRPTAAVSVSAVAGLRVTGTITGGGVRGPGTTPTATGATLAGTLDGTAAFDVTLPAGGRLGLHLDVRPRVDPRTVTPPAPARSWRRWAGRSPSPTDVARATQTLAVAAANAARAAEYTPYLQADVPGPDRSTFTYVMAAAPRAPRPADVVHPKPGAIAATLLAVLAILGNAALLHRRL